MLLLIAALATKGFPQLEREAMLAEALTALDEGLDISEPLSAQDLFL